MKGTALGGFAPHFGSGVGTVGGLAAVQLGGALGGKLRPLLGVAEVGFAVVAVVGHAGEHAPAFIGEREVGGVAAQHDAVAIGSDEDAPAGGLGFEGGAQVVAGVLLFAE